MQQYNTFTIVGDENRKYSGIVCYDIPAEYRNIVPLGR